MPKRKPPPKTNDRTHGEGSIVEVSPGVFRAWTAPDELGKRRSKRFASRAEAHRWLVGDPEPAVLYVGDYLERWLTLREPTLRGRTPQTYQQFVGYAEDGPAPISVIPLATLTTDDCQAWLNGLLKTHTRYAVKVTRGIVSSALNAAVPALIPANPMKATRLPTPDERPVKAWSHAEVARLLEAARGTSHAIWFAFAIGTGLRLGELRALVWSDIDFTEMTVRVSKSMDNNTNEVGPPKTNRSRTVDIPEELIPELRAHKLRQAPGNEYVFGHDGRAYNPTAYRYWLRATCLRAGVHDAEEKTLGVHSTRHTAASLLLSQNVEPIEVAHMLGHASLATTLNIYGHWIPRQRRRTASALGRVLASVSGDLHRDLHRETAATR